MKMSTRCAPRVATWQDLADMLLTLQSATYDPTGVVPPVITLSGTNATGQFMNVTVKLTPVQLATVNVEQDLLNLIAENLAQQFPPGPFFTQLFSQLTSPAATFVVQG
jgi:hypothetical protein